jgi:CRP/FNR family transcriptional regulator, polysaccharide utilization system transcription regulator
MNSYTILLIEDNIEMAENIASILRLVDYKVLLAHNGKSGVELAKLKKPDLIICDIMMPDLDGFGVLHILSKDTELFHTPFVFLSARSDSHDIRSGMNLGADDYITKPFDGLDLLKVIEIRLKKKEHIKTAPFGADGSSDTLNHSAEAERLSLHKHSRIFRKKDLIFMEGQSAFDLYYIVSGNVKTYKVNYEGKELITGFSSAGDFLGYIPLLEDKAHHESAEVLDEAEIAIIPKQDFLDIIYSSKVFSRKFIQLLSRNVVNIENRLLDIAYQSVRQRVAGALLQIHNFNQQENSKYIITITRRDISSLIGTATESLNRTLADFREEGLIEIKDDGIRILEKLKLEKNCRQVSLISNRVMSKY